MSDDAPFLTTVVVVVACIVVVCMAGAHLKGVRRGHHDILSQAVRQGVLRIDVDPITLERTYVWITPVEARK